MSLDIEYTASCGTSKIEARITTPIPTTNANSAEAVTHFVLNTIDRVANMVKTHATTIAPTTSPPNVFQSTNGHADADTRPQVWVRHSLDNMLMLIIYDPDGTARPIFAKGYTKVSEVFERILNLGVGTQDLVLVNYLSEVLDLDATFAECRVEDGEALWMKAKKSEETWSGVVAER